MKDRPILFSAPMVRALLDGTKTQTRRIMKPQPEGEPRPLSEWSVGLAAACGDNSPDPDKLADHQKRLEWKVFPFTTPSGGLVSWPCPYGQPGDRLWVRETWGYRCSASTPEADRYMHTIAYRADDVRRTYGPMPIQGVGLPKWRERDEGMSWEAWDARMTAYWRQWRPSIHMPLWASRIILEITGVRVERLQDISREDAEAEGWNPAVDVCSPLIWYAALWESINGPGSWALNPWVWVISFHRVEKKHGSS